MVWMYIPLSFITAPFKSDAWIFALQVLLPAFSLWFFICKGPLEKLPKHQFWFFVLFALMSGFRSGLLWDFREDIIATSAMLTGLTFFYQGRVFYSTLFFCMALWSKENLPYILSIFAVVVIFTNLNSLPRRTRIIFGVSILCLSVLTCFLFTRVLTPFFMGPIEPDHPILGIFPGMGNSLVEFQRNVALHPFEFLMRYGPHVLTPRSLLYLAAVTSPWIIWGWKTWVWALPAAATALLNALASTNQNSGRCHYELVMIPFMMFSVALAIRDQTAGKNFSLFKKRWAYALLLALCFTERGPLFETTDRLLNSGHRIMDAVQLQFWHVEQEPLAASINILPHFNRIQNIRLLQLPEQLSEFENDPKNALEKVKEVNPILTLSKFGRDISDARTFVLDLEKPAEFAFAKVLEASGARVAARTSANESRGLVMIETPAPFSEWISK